jgi:hypothetical protein
MSRPALVGVVAAGVVVVFLGGLWVRLRLVSSAAHALRDAGALPVDGDRTGVVVLAVLMAAVPGALVALAVLAHARRGTGPRAALIALTVVVAGIAQATVPAVGRLGTGSGVPGFTDQLLEAGIDAGWAGALTAAVFAGNLISIVVAVAGGVGWYLIRRRRADTLGP